MSSPARAATTRFDPATVKARTFASLRALWIAESRRSRLVLVVCSAPQQTLAGGGFWPMSAHHRRALTSDLRLLCHLQSVVNLNPEIADGALQLRVPEQ